MGCLPFSYARNPSGNDTRMQLVAQGEKLAKIIPAGGLWAVSSSRRISVEGTPSTASPNLAEPIA